jgi:hypothetical protein
MDESGGDFVAVAPTGLFSCFAGLPSAYALG